MKSYLGRTDLPRGMRNNNPGNLRISTTPWKGKIPADKNTDGSFEQFTSYPWGVRALIKQLKTDFSRGNNTIRKLVSKYAPANENDTESYINAVSSMTKIGPDVPLNADYNTLAAFSKAIGYHENGTTAITDEDFAEAWKLI